MKHLYLIKDKLYDIVVRKNPEIRSQYERYVNTHREEHRSHRIKSWLFLLRLHALNILGAKNLSEEEDRCPPVKCSESELGGRVTVSELIRKLSDYDVISFDIFDTLVFRPFSDPKDLFQILAADNGYMDFARIRVEMEEKARKIKFKNENTYEVNLEEIYSLLSAETGLPKEEYIQREIDAEMEFCFANPYMLEVYNELLKLGKKIIIISDMYLPSEILTALLNKCGYIGFERLFVSNEYAESKAKGGLYKIAGERLGLEKSYIHVGDNYKSDVENAKKQGFETVYYKNVNELGSQYRSHDMSAIIGGAYRGIVNQNFYNGLNRHTMPYEYGYAYGGIFVLGYCNYIHNFCENNSIDKILFLARDGEILKKAYDLLFPEEKTEYVYWSRLAAAKLAANQSKYDYIRRFILHKADKDIPLERIFKAMEIEPLLNGLECNLRETLTKKNTDYIIAFVNEHWNDILNIYSPQIEAGKLYYQKILADCKKAAAVDVGWAGSGANYLSYMVNGIWDIDCEIVGILAGTNTANNYEKNASEGLLLAGKLNSYMYSQSFNRDLWKFHDPDKKHNIYFEMLLSSVTPSFKGFYPKEDDVELKFIAAESQNFSAINEIQRGILDFIKEYMEHFKSREYMINISGSDAYAPFMVACGKNGVYMDKVLANCTFNPDVGE